MTGVRLENSLVRERRVQDVHDDGTAAPLQRPTAIQKADRDFQRVDWGGVLERVLGSLATSDSPGDVSADGSPPSGALPENDQKELEVHPIARMKERIFMALGEMDVAADVLASLLPKTGTGISENNQRRLASETAGMRLLETTPALAGRQMAQTPDLGRVLVLKRRTTESAAAQLSEAAARLERLVQRDNRFYRGDAAALADAQLVVSAAPIHGHRQFAVDFGYVKCGSLRPPADSSAAIVRQPAAAEEPAGEARPSVAVALPDAALPQWVHWEWRGENSVKEAWAAAEVGHGTPIVKQLCDARRAVFERELFDALHDELADGIAARAATAPLPGSEVGDAPSELSMGRRALAAAAAHAAVSRTRLSIPLALDAGVPAGELVVSLRTGAPPPNPPKGQLEAVRVMAEGWLRVAQKRRQHVTSRSGLVARRGRGAHARALLQRPPTGRVAGGNVSPPQILARLFFNLERARALSALRATVDEALEQIGGAAETAAAPLPRALSSLDAAYRCAIPCKVCEDTHATPPSLVVSMFPASEALRRDVTVQLLPSAAIRVVAAGLQIVLDDVALLVPLLAQQALQSGMRAIALLLGISPDGWQLGDRGLVAPLSRVFSVAVSGDLVSAGVEFSFSVSKSSISAASARAMQMAASVLRTLPSSPGPSVSLDHFVQHLLTVCSSR